MGDPLEPSTGTVVDALRRWGVEQPARVKRAESGMMNETFLVTTDQATVVLRRHRRTRRDQIEFEHTVIQHAHTSGIPTPVILSTSQGEGLVEHDGAFYTMFAFARGHQVERDALTPAMARSMGRMLGQLDIALADYAVDLGAERERSTDLSLVRTAIDGLLEKIDSIRHPSEQDRWAAVHLRSKMDWLRTAEPPTWQSPPRSARQLVHGDFLESNVFFDDRDVVVDVIDWDKTRSGWPAAEIVRTLDLSLGMNPELCADFLAGYRTVRGVSFEELDHAAMNWHHSHVHDHWVLEGIYLRHDDRLRALISPGPFVPFADRWSRLRSVL